MSLSRLHTRLSGLMLLSTLVLAVPYAAADEPESPEAIVTVEIDLGPLVAPPPVRGPNLATPADLIARQDVGMPAAWNHDPADQREPWLPFELQPDMERLAASPEEWIDLFGSTEATLQQAFEELDDAGVSASGGRAYVRVPPRLADTAREHAAWSFDALLPTGRIDMILERVAPEMSVRAVGRAVLFPGRWTAVAFVKEELPCVVGSHIEIAQDAVILNPEVANLLEGHEVYARLLPGESRCVVEIWVGEVEHLETARLDLRGLQGPLRASELTTLTLPTSRVRRVGTALVLGNGRREERVLAWRRGDTVERLRLSIETPGPGPAPRPGGESRQHAALRLGARHGRLELARRGDYEPDLEESLAMYVNRADPSGELTADSNWGTRSTGAAIVAAPPVVIESMRGALLEAERHDLVALDARIDLLAVPEETWRAGGGADVLFPGLPLPAQRRAALEAEGAVLVAGLSFPAVLGLRSSFRVGESVPGLIDLDTEVAEKAAGFSPITWSLFDGLFGSVELRRRGDSYVLDVRAEATWASAQSGEVTLSRADGGEVKLPLAGGGGTDLSASHLQSAAPTEPHIAAVAVRGGHVLLLVVDVRAAP